MYEMLNIPAHMNCIGCGECCGPVLATRREIDVIKLYVAKNPIIRGIARLHQDDEPHVCCFLDRGNKQCLVYPVRPLVCRLMGVVGGMECANGNSAELDGSVFLQEHTVGTLNLLNTEAW